MVNILAAFSIIIQGKCGIIRLNLFVQWIRLAVKLNIANNIGSTLQLHYPDANCGFEVSIDMCKVRNVLQIPESILWFSTYQRSLWFSTSQSSRETNLKDQLAYC